MKVFKEKGSKERFVDMFQKVNKIQLNEAFGQNLNPQNALNVAFDELKNRTLTIKHSNTQEKDNESYVELLCVDKQGNQITFTFRAIIEESDQEGVFDVTDVVLDSFSFDEANSEESAELSGDALKQFNAQHENELFDIVNKYIDVEEEVPAEEENLYQEAVKKIDSYPFGGKDRKGMQTGKAYADEKPTNPDVRVKAPELEKFVNEDDYDDFALPLDYGVEDKKAIMQSDRQQLEKEPEVEDEPPIEISDEKKQIILQAYDNLMIKNINNPSYSPTLEEVMAEINNVTGQNIKNPIRKKRAILPAQEPFVEEGDQQPDQTAVKVFYNEHQDEIDDDWEEYIDRLRDSFEHKKHLLNCDECFWEWIEKSYWNDETQRFEYKYPAHVMDEDYENIVPSQMVDKYIKKYEKELPQSTKYDLIKKAANIASNKLGSIRYKLRNEEYMEYIRNIANQLYADKLKEMNEDEYPDVIGKEFKPETHYPKKKKKIIKKIKIKTDEAFEDDDDSDVAIVDVPTDKKAEKQAKSDIAKSISHPISYDTKFEFNEENEYPEGETPEGETDDGTSLEPETDDIEKIAQDKEERGELIPGGKGEGKSPLEFDPEQIKLGMKVEMEHTDDPMIALEITLDHLTEDPEYYTVKNTPETSAQVGASKDAAEGNEEGEEEKPHESGAYLQDGMPGELDRNGHPIPSVDPNFVLMRKDFEKSDDDDELTDRLLGYEPKNVGDKIEDELGESKESELKQKNPAAWHQVQIAKKTLKMPDAMVGVMGGPSKEEAKEILKKYGIIVNEEIIINGSTGDSIDKTSTEYKQYEDFRKKKFDTLNDTDKKKYFELFNKYKGTE